MTGIEPPTRDVRAGGRRRAEQILPWALAILVPIGVAVAFIPVRSHVASADVVLVLVVVVLGAALFGGRSPGAVAAVSAALAFDFFQTRPYYSFRIDSAQDIETAALLLIVGLAIGDLVTRRRRDRAAAASSGAELERLHQLTALAAGGETPSRLIYRVQNELIAILGVEDCEFQRPPFVDAMPRLRHGGIMIPPQVGLVEQEPEAYRHVELPIWGEGLELGRFVLTLSGPAVGIELPPAARRAAVALADQLGVILLAHAR